MSKKGGVPPLREDVVKMLTALGVTGADADPLLDYIVQVVTDTIKNATNQPAIPKGLESAAIFNAVGQYLNLVKNTGKLEGFDLEAAVKQIKEGDTSITFAFGDGDMTPEGRLEALVSWLSSYGKGQYNRYRRLIW